MDFTERRVVLHPTPKYSKLVRAEAADDCARLSHVVNKIIENHYDSLPQSEIDRLLKVYDNLDENEKCNRKGKRSKNHY